MPAQGLPGDAFLQFLDLPDLAVEGNGCVPADGDSLPLPTLVVVFLGTALKKWWWAIAGTVVLAVLWNPLRGLDAQLYWGRGIANNFHGNDPRDFVPKDLQKHGIHFAVNYVFRW